MKRILFLIFLFQSLNSSENQNVYGGIICGGSGKRLWPLSTHDVPKQFIPLIGNQSLLLNTIERIENLTTKNSLFAITTKNYAKKIQEQTDKMSFIFLEPSPRGTAAAIIFPTLRIHQKDPNAVIFFVPADHYIPDIKSFEYSMQKAIDFAKNNDKIVLLGIKPTFPAIDYGYIEYEVTKNEIQPVSRFHEKPKKDVAQQYLKAGNFFWNSGIFCAKASVFLDECQKHAPHILNGVKKFLYSSCRYEDIFEDSFDYAVLEKSSNCCVLPAHFEWSDVGSLEQFLTIKKQNSNSNNSIEINANGNLASSKKLVVLYNVSNLCVVETDDVIFVTNKNETSGIKKVVDHLKTNGFEKYI